MKFDKYHPASLLSILSKVFEMAMYSRLIHFLAIFQLYSINGDYCLTKSIDNGGHVIGVFLDFNKAFDTVDLGILLSKLYHCGIRGIAFK